MQCRCGWRRNGLPPASLQCRIIAAHAMPSTDAAGIALRTGEPSDYGRDCIPWR